MKKILLVALFVVQCVLCNAQVPPSVHIEGRNIVDSHGNKVVMHGVMDTPNSYFNGGRWGSGDANIPNCITYFNNLFTAITDHKQGAYCDVFRLHLDPCWTNNSSITAAGFTKSGNDWIDPDGIKVSGEADIHCFDKERLSSYMTSLYWKIIDKALKCGLHVVVRPPGVCPEKIRVGGYYQEYLMTVWDIFSQNMNVKRYAGQISIELANEPVSLVDQEGKDTPRAMHDFFQPIVDKIRANGFTGIIWVPGTGWQSNYRNYADYPIEGYNIGYAAHAYVGWYGCNDDNATGERFLKNFIEAVPVVKNSPVIITEIDWSPANNNNGHYNEHGDWVPGNYGTWATGTTSKWGNAFKYAKDQLGNVSMTLTGTGDLIDIDKYLNEKKVVAAFSEKMTADGLDPREACGQACLDWYAEYAKVDFARPDFKNLSTNITPDQKSFINPVIAADFPDPDVARLGDTYYFLSTTMHLMPGATVLKSKDLVNWEYCCNPLENMSSADKYNLLNGQHSYSQGMWAGAIEEHNGKLYILLNCNDAGGYVLSTDDPEGKWEVKKLSRSYYDPGMIIEEDRIYIVCGINHINICELDKDWNFIKETNVIQKDNAGLEGSHLYHIGDYYYIYATYGGWPTGQTIFRSTSVTGPYEEKSSWLLEKTINGTPNTVHQGALIEIPESGEWWTLLMEDKGALGRLPSLHPVTWADGWPTIAKNGVPQSSYTRPNVGTGYPTAILPTNDNFRTYRLGKQWQWNHHAPQGEWSLLERPGYLRLYTSSVTDDFMMARGTLTQRIFAFHKTTPYGLNTTKPSTGTIALDVSGMETGDIAGIAVQQDPYTLLGVQKNEDETFNLVWKSGTLTEISDFTPASKSIALKASDFGSEKKVIYLRAQFTCGNGETSFSYSLDNQTWTAIGDKVNLRFNLSVFVGARWAIFNYATQAKGGYVDVDWFSTESSFTEDDFFAPFEGYNSDMLTATSLSIDKEEMEIMTGAASDISLIATFADGHTENVAASAKYTTNWPELLNIANGRIKGMKDGTANVIATYTDPLGNMFETSFRVTSSYFPFSKEFITTNLFSEGTYDENTRTFKPGQWGQMGWVYSSGIDISGYKYLVLKLDKVQNCSAALQIFTDGSIWGNNYRVDLGSQKQIVVKLQTIKYSGGDAVKGQPVDLSNVRIVDFWGNGSGTIDVADMYLTNNDDYSREMPSGIENIKEDENNLLSPSSQPHDIFDLQGRRVLNPSRGIYIVNGHKIWIK